MTQLPLPEYFNAQDVATVRRIPYEERAKQARDFALLHKLEPASASKTRSWLMLIDVQNTFCIPEFELYVGGRSGRGAVEDNARLCGFIYRNLGAITQIIPSLDTHHAMQVFHAIWLVDEQGNHPQPYELVSVDDVESGRWRMNAAVAEALGIDVGYAERHLADYTRRLAEGGKYDLTVWPYHAMLGGIGYALVSAVEEAIFFHGTARHSQPDFQVKGDNPLTEHYSMLGPEVTEGPDGDRLGRKNTELIAKLLTFDVVVVAGQAKSHCMAWTIDDLLEEEEAGDRLAERTYLLEDCTSPVVVPGVVDYTDEANAAFERYAAAGMHVVRSTDPIESWPGVGDRMGAPHGA